jgi:hypothetical protein
VGKVLFIAFMGAALVVVLAWRIRRMSRLQRERDEARKRWVIGPGGGERIPLATPEPRGAWTTASRLEEGAAMLSEADDPPTSSSLDDSPLPAPARLVLTPDGEMVLTAPPFALRESIVTPGAGALLRGIAGRLPREMVLCPRVRLESLVQPTSPVDRDPDDWRRWRRRVRLRSVDAAICRVEAGPDGESGGWRPVLAIEIDLPLSVSRNSAPDRIVDDVLEAAGLPVVHVDAGATVEQAWTLIGTRLEL